MGDQNNTWTPSTPLTPANEWSSSCGCSSPEAPSIADDVVLTGVPASVTAVQNDKAVWSLVLNMGPTAGDFALQRYSDSGGLIDSPISASRATGAVSFNDPVYGSRDPVDPLELATKEYVDSMPGHPGPQGPQGPQGATGPMGPQGPQGPQGAAGQSAIIVGNFGASKTPAQLPPSGLIPANWDAPGVPPAQLQMQAGQALFYTVNEHVWTWVGSSVPGGWIDLGAQQGPQGPQGPAGPPGSQGIQGTQGVQGVAGPVGSPGPAGVQGPTGPQGVQGAPGQTAIVVGSFSNQPTSSLPVSGLIPANWDAPGSPPSSVQLQPGQGLVDTRTNFIWSWVGTSINPTGWIELGAVQGPPGPTGPQGAQGSTGVAGAVGPTGPQGVAGPQGPSGAAGSAGPQGPAGPVGAQGIQGATGPQGPQGPAGPVPEAPTDGQLYVRRGSDTSWQVAPSGGAGSVTVSDTAPVSPHVGDLWWDSRGGQLYIWYNDGNTTQWVVAVNAGGSASVTISDTAPANPIVGTLWFDSVGQQLYTWYNDGNSTQWVPTSNQTGILQGGTVNGPLSVPAGISAPNVIGDNRVINGDMRVDQRNNGASGTATNVYTVDRWRFDAAQTGKFTWGRNYGGIAAFVSFPYFLAAMSGTAYAAVAGDYFALTQVIEADQISDFAWGTASAQPVTLSFWAFTNGVVTGTFSGAISNAATTRSYPFTFSLPTASTWTRVVVTIPGDTAGTWVMSGNAGGAMLRFDLGSGSTYRGPAGAWAGTQYIGATGAVSIVGNTNAYLAVTGVKFEVGNIATPFNRKSLAKSLADCQRYYASGQVISGGSMTTSQVLYAPYSLPVTMRANPTLAVTGNTSSNLTSPTINVINSRDLYAQGTATATGGTSVNIGFTASAEL